MKLKRAGIMTKIVIFVLIVYASVALINMRAQIETAMAKQEDLKQQVTDIQTSNEQLQYDIDHRGDKNTIANVARDDFGLVAPGEKVFYDTGK